MRYLALTVILSILLSIPLAQAAPYCDALMETETLPKKYQKKGPFYSDARQGWIVANDQLVSDFELGSEASFLMAKITESFKTRGMQLVLVVPPPRPLFMDVSINGYDPEKAVAYFQSYLDNIADTGVIAPNLLPKMKAALGQEAYFKRDTHWTPKGAAFAAFNVAQHVGQIDQLERDFLNLEFTEPYLEKGSLTAVVDKICNTNLQPEKVMVASFTKQGTASDLLSDTENNKKKIALAGTSFSDRYGRDVYRFSDALSFVFDAEVENYSVSGGGIISAMETLILSDAFQAQNYHTVIWEVPYTQSLSDTHSLRQILGALHASDSEHFQEIYNGSVGSDWQSVLLSSGISRSSTLQVVTESTNLKQVDVEFYDHANTKMRFKLRKSRRIPLELQSDIWSLSLEGLDISTVTKVKIRSKAAKSKQDLSVKVIK